MQDQIQRDLKSREIFLSVFQLRNDQKIHPCALKQPEIAESGRRGWGYRAFGEHLAGVQKWDANALPCAVPDSVAKPILKNTHSLLELNFCLFPPRLGLHS